MATASVVSSQLVAERGCSLSDRMKHGSRGLFCSSTRSCHLSDHDRGNDFAAPEQWIDSAENLQALQQLQRRLASHPHGCPDEATLKWFLRDSDFSADAAEVQLKAMLAWRATNRLFDVRYEDVAEQHRTGKAYLHSYLDKAGRPAVVIRTRKHFIGQFPIADSKRLSAYMLDSAVAMLQQQQQQLQQLQQQQQQQEQILWVVDLQGISMRNIDLAFVMFVLQAVPECYPRRVGQVLLVDAPWIFKAPWEAFKPLLRKYAALVRFVSRKELAVEYLTADSLPADFRK